MSPSDSLAFVINAAQRLPPSMHSNSGGKIVLTGSFAKNTPVYITGGAF